MAINSSRLLYVIVVVVVVVVAVAVVVVLRDSSCRIFWLYFGRS